MGIRIVVVGGGPGGYTCAIKAAQLGAEVILAEASGIGGTCLNVGCVPTKSLLQTAGFYCKAALNSVPGVIIPGAELDWPAVQDQKDKTVRRLSGGVSALLRHNGVKVYNEKAVLLPDRSIRIGAETMATDAIVLATGSHSARLDFPGADLPGVIDSTEALSLEKVPASLVIVGGGVIGVEFAALYASLGVKTTIIELTPHILPSMDAEIAEYVPEMLATNGVEVFTNAKLVGANRTVDDLAVCYEVNGATRIVTAEKLLIAVGRQPNTSGFGLENLSVKMTRGAITTDEYFQSSIPWLYAVGDCNGQIMLAHAAMAQGEAAAEHIMGFQSRVNQRLIPACAYSSPEIAAVGMTEEQVAASGVDYSVGRFDLGGNARAVIEESGGFVKIIADKKLGEILGVHIIAPHATEMIAAAALCMSLEGTVEDIAATIHAHPTVSESLREAAMSVFGKPIHAF